MTLPSVSALRMMSVKVGARGAQGGAAAGLGSPPSPGIRGVEEACWNCLPRVQL